MSASIKEPSAVAVDAALKRDDRLGALLFDLPKQVAWWEGRIFDGVKFLQRDDGWLLVVEAHRAKGGPEVCFHWAKTMPEAFWQFCYGMNHRPGNAWRPSKF